MDAQTANLTRSYVSLNDLDELRLAAKERSPDATTAVAEQFEALFIQMMLKAMREGGPKDSFLISDQERFYQDLFDKQIALDLATKKQLGIAEMLVRQLGGPSTAPAAESAAEVNPFASQFPRIPKHLPAQTRAPSAAPAAVRAERFASPESFVAAVAPHARRAGEELGVSPELLIAQAALETGWGAHMIQHRDGRSSHNLFGIKADARWQGPRVAVPSLEFAGGVAERRLSAFRSYGSIGESFDDYVAFLKGNDRYRLAVEQAGDARSYITELQRAGYATDPNYARKVLDIMNRNVNGVKVLAAIQP